MTVNERFAEAAAGVADEGGQVWIQDYQLQLVPQMLRQLRPDLRIGFFLHIPFPPTELFQQLPWRSQILQGLLGADLVGFQLPGGAQNFVRLVRQRFSLRDPAGPHPHARRADGGRAGVPDRHRLQGHARPGHGRRRRPRGPGRSGPISVTRRRSSSGVDRLDYTKGLPERIRAFGELVAEGTVDPEDAVFLQVATPSRERVEQYRLLRDDIDRLVGRINGDTGRLGRPPIIYLHNSYPREEMAAMYRAADVMVVTPLRDGMNLVAKEYVACRDGDNGALVLSEFTGAAKELRQAYLVNPHDIDGLKSTMVAAAEDSARNKARRMRIMRRHVFDHDIDHWAGQFLDDLSKLGPGSDY